MRIYDEGTYRDMTAEEIAALQALFPQKSYEARVAERIRAKYSVDDELAILRQKDTKPEEFAEYYAFAEKVKAEEKEK